MNAKRLAAAWALAAAATSGSAQTDVRDAWVRSTVPQQRATGMFAQITSASGGRLIAATSPLAGAVEIHEMSMQGDVMRMRAMPGLDLPAGRAVELKPGGLHLMLIELKHPLRAGDLAPVTLVVEDKDGRRESVEVSAPVKALGGGSGDPGP